MTTKYPFLITKYPFYCIEGINRAEAAQFMHFHLRVDYGWTLDKEIWGSVLSPSFFTTKMHVFTIIINKGFKI